MSFVPFFGRLFFVSIFVFVAYQEFIHFGNDGGPAAKTLKPKLDVLFGHVATVTGFHIPHVEVELLVVAAIGLKALGSFLFLFFGSCFGASILALHQIIFTPILYDFYSYDTDTKEFSKLFGQFIQNVALLGGTLFYIGMKNSAPRRSHRKKGSKTKTN